MTQLISEVSKIRRRVLIEVAKSLYKGSLIEEIESIPRKLVDDGITHYRCCKHKEMAILKERIKLSLGVNLAKADTDRRLSSYAKEILKEKEVFEDDNSFISIIEEACDQCSIEKIVVTNTCRNCVAHNCVNICPKQAMTIVENRVYIIRDKCIECGLCVKACSYGAIIEIDRPCNRACPVGAIVPGDKTTARIDSNICVECGSCIVACPFGAISFRSEMAKVINYLKNEDKRVVALVAPSYIGQFGTGVTWEKLVYALKKMGFYDAVMVAAGADKVIEKESKELIEKVSRREDILFNSCCPSFKNLIKIHFPELRAYISSTDSPMLETARTILDIDESLHCIFIGPCLGKKGEAFREGQNLIDAVLTFEELIAIFVAVDINLAAIELGEDLYNDKEKSLIERELLSRQNNPAQASNDAANFCQNGGVGQAILNHLKENYPDFKFDSSSVSGLSECKKMLEMVAKGEHHYDFVEGMGCIDGCIGGPGTLVKPAKAIGILKKMSREACKNFK